VAGPSTAQNTGRPPPDAPALVKADYWYGLFEEALNLIAALSIFGIMVLGVVQIASRGISGTLHDFWPAIQPIAIEGYIDWMEYVAVLYAVLGIAYCQRLGGHIRMEIVLAQFRGRALWTFELIATLIALAITVALVDATWDNFMRAFEKGDSSMDIRLAQWPSKLIVPLALATLAVRLVLQVWGYARLVLEPARRPLAIPMVLSTAEVAQQEIAEVLGKGDTANKKV